MRAILYQYKVRRALAAERKRRERAAAALDIAVTPGDAEMVASWAEEGLKGHDNPVARDAVRRFRAAFNDAARAAPFDEQTSASATASAPTGERSS